MTDHVYKTIEVTGSSPDGVEAAITAATAKAAESLHNLRWFEVTDIRGELDGARVKFWQVTMKVGFTLDANAGA
ncbi:MAG: dodecin family protein [Pseudomonadales bacterium]